jgi:hypothetical protein
MASKHTEHFNLSQWEASDAVLREDFNRDNATIDTALKKCAFPNCKFVTGSYTGTGAYGSDNPCVLTFDCKPQIIFLDTAGYNHYNSIPEYYILFRGSNYLYGRNFTGSIGLAWDDNTVSWWYSKDAYNQFNESEKVYCYMALCTEE